MKAQYSFGGPMQEQHCAVCSNPRRRVKTVADLFVALLRMRYVMLRYCLALAAAAFMAACEPTTMSGPVSTQPEQGQPASFSANESARSFIRVLQTVELVAERECRVRTNAQSASSGQ